MRGGFTWVELLIALAISSLIVGAVYLIYFSTLNVVEYQSRNTQKFSEAQFALHQLTLDLTRSLKAEYEQCVFTLAATKQESPPTLHLSFCTLQLNPNVNELNRHEIIQVVYQVENGQLLRSKQSLLGPDATLEPLTNILLTGVQHFEITAFDGENWQNTWDDDAWPSAVSNKITYLKKEQPETLQTRIIIPYGYKVSSTLIRNATPPTAP